MNWISVKDEQKPEDCEDVLCLVDVGAPVVLTYIVGKGDLGQFYMDFPARSYFENWTEFVTHWQSIDTNTLPEPPETETPGD